VSKTSLTFLKICIYPTLYLIEPCKRAWNPLENLTTNKFKKLNVKVKGLSDRSATTKKDSRRFYILFNKLKSSIVQVSFVSPEEQSTQTELQIVSIGQPLVSIETRSSDIPELFTIDTMIQLEEIYDADAQQSVLNTSLDDGVEEDGYDVINQDDEDGDRIKPTGSSNSSGTIWAVNDVLNKNEHISCQAGIIFFPSLNFLVSFYDIHFLCTRLEGYAGYGIYERRWLAYSALGGEGRRHR